MKKFIFLAMLFAAIDAIAITYKMDTSYFQKGTSLFKEITVILQDTTKVADIEEGINIDIFSKSELEQLEKGGEVKKENPGKETLARIFPIIETTTNNDGLIYGQTDGVLKKTGNWTAKPLYKKLYAQSIIGIYIPFILVLVIACMNVRRKRKIFLKFSITTTLAIAIAVAIGMFVYEIVGLVVGTIAAGLAGGLAEKPKTSETVIIGVFAGGLAGGLAGVNFIILPGEFTSTIWQYVLGYAAVCTVGLMIRETIVLIKKIRERLNVRKEPA